MANLSGELEKAFNSIKSFRNTGTTFRYLIPDKPPGIPFEVVKDAGFTRVPCPDKVYTEKTGYDFFYMEKELMKGFRCEWTPADQIATIFRKHKGEVIETIELDDTQEFLTLIHFLAK